MTFVPKAIIAVTALFIPFASIAFSQAPAQSVEAHARTVLGQIVSGQFGAVEAEYTARVKAALPVGKLAEAWAGLTAQVGNFKSVTEAHSQQAGGYDIVTLVCAFDHAILDTLITFSSDGQIAGIRFVPHQEQAAWTPPAYSNPVSFTEQSVTVQFQHWSLPGTLTLPKGDGPFPLVVLVQGSGPHDEDETIGPNKPFKDLAWGLASQGVAVLRYVKRTKQYGIKSSDDPAALTVDDETVNDARAAVAFAARQPAIDPKRIFVLGHSLGGYLAPRIAQNDPQVAGLVLMAGSCRPLEQIAIEQVRYLVGISGLPADQAQERIAQAEQDAKVIESPDLKPGGMVRFAGVQIPASYFLDLRGYHPAEVAASLKIPILVLRGSRDYQVTSEDFDAWKSTLGGHANATFKLYPGLTHLFMPSSTPGDGLGTPQDYDHLGHVDPHVVRDIASWVLARGRVAQ